MQRTIISPLSAALVAILALFGVVASAQAATLFGPVNTTVDNTGEYSTGLVDASSYENLTLFFEYDSEALETGESFTYGWRDGGGDNDLATIPGVDADVFASPVPVSVPLPLGAQVADLEIYVSVNAANSPASDFVEITNLEITGDLAACAPQYDVAGPTDIQNTTTGEYFSSLQDAVNDCDTVDGDTILMGADVVTVAQVNLSKTITLDGGGNTLFANFARTDNSNNSALGIIDTDDVTVKNLTIDSTGGTNLHGINVYLSNGVVVENVASKNNRSGLVVNGSEVTATDYRTAGNVWHGINVAQGGGVTDQAKLTINATSEHSEVAPTPHIFVDDIDFDYVVDDVDGQYTFIEFAFPSLAKPDRIARAYYLDGDTDTDGVKDSIDLCDDTMADEFLEWGGKKGKNRWQFDGANWVVNGKPGTQGGFAPTIEDTYGCSGEQILDVLVEKTGKDFDGHYKFGLSKSLIEAWMAGEYNLGPAVLDTVFVSGESADVTESTLVAKDGVEYTLNAMGTYRFASWGDFGVADAEWASRRAANYPAPGLTEVWPDLGETEGWVKGEGYYASECGLDVQVDGACVDWGAFSETNEYSLPYTGTGAPIEFSIFDSSYGDNVGGITVEIVGDLIIDLW